MYAKERNLCLFYGYKNGKLVGIAPLSIGKKRSIYFKHLKYRTLWLLGSGRTKARGVISDYNGFIVIKHVEKDFVNAFIKYIHNYSSWDEMILEYVSKESSLPELLENYAKKQGLIFSIVQKTQTILIKLPNTWEGFLKEISAGLRYKIRRGRKEFEKLGGTYHLIKDEGELPEAFSDLERLHQYRWTSKGEAGAFSSPEWKQFHNKLMPRLLKKRRLKLSFLRLDGNSVAANYNFAFDNKIHFYQSGLVPHQNKHVRLGLLLHSYCIEEAIHEGFEEYDFLQVGNSGAGYKALWGNYSRDLLTIRIARRSNKERLYKLLLWGKSQAGIIKDRVMCSS